MRIINKTIAVLIAMTMIFTICGCNGSSKKSDDTKSDSTVSDDGPVIKGTGIINQVSSVGMLTGANSQNRTDTNWGVGGCDLGIPVYDADAKRMYIIFGDSYSDPKRVDNWRSNIISVTSDLNASDNVKIDSFINNNRPIAKEIITSLKVDNQEITVIPTGGIVINKTFYLYYMSVRHWGIPGEWTINYSGVVKSADDCNTWSKVDDLIWAGFTDVNTQTLTGLSAMQLKQRYAPNYLQIFPIDGKDGYIYLYGIPGGRSGGVKLARVKPESIEKFSDYEYYTKSDASGNPVFEKGTTGLKTVESSESSYVISPKAGEMSIMYNAYLKKWMAMYQVGTGIILRTSDTPWGKWSSPTTVVTAESYEELYCSFMNEAYTEDNGKTVYFFMSQWSLYNVRTMKLEFK